MIAHRPVEVYASDAGNAFMVDIAGWIAEAAEELGHEAHVVADGSLPGDGTCDAICLAVAPHELFELSRRPMGERRTAAAWCIPVATEQPGTTWFERSVGWCRLAPWALDINEVAVEEAVGRGLDVRLLRLGAVPSMDRVGDGVERPVDVAVLAGLTPHRAERLAALAPSLWHRRCELRLLSPGRPTTGASAPAVNGAVFGAAKYDLLARSKILLNVHRDAETTYFEWARAVEAMANGCVVVTEPSASIGSLVDGEHLVVAHDLDAAINELLDDDDRRSRIAGAAYDLVHGPLALARSLEPLLSDAAEALDDSPTAPRRPPSLRRSRGERPSRPAFRPHRALRRRLFDAVVAERTHRRQIDAARARARGLDPRSFVVTDAAAWSTCRPDVSVIVTLFDYADVVAETLDSIAATQDVVLEIVVVDDHSTDLGPAVVREWMASRPDVALRLVERHANHGLAAARRLAVEQSRADLVMVLDADNLVYPTCLRRLADALDDDPTAAMAWSILQVFGDRPGLLSAHAWDPAGLAERNLIDAQVMFRRAALVRLGGHRELDGLLAGWEDWDLWLRMVAAGDHGVLVPEMLGRYRAQSSSMVAAPNRYNDVMLERFEALHPTIDFPPR